jgi:hypothetical protein
VISYESWKDQRREENDMIIEMNALYLILCEETKNEGWLKEKAVSLKEKTASVLGRALEIMKKAGDLTKVPFVRLCQIIEESFGKLPRDKQDSIRHIVNKHAEEMSKRIETKLNSDVVLDAVKKVLHESINDKTLDEQDMTGSLARNKEEITRRVRAALSATIESIKSDIASGISDMHNEAERSLLQRIKDGSRDFAIGSSFMIGFGFIDNFALFVGMGMIDEELNKMGFDSITSAGIGNAFSDVVGVLFGGAILFITKKIIGSNKRESTRLEQIFGLVVGCMIPVVGWVVYQIITTP